MARRRKKGFGKKSKSIPVAPLIPIAFVAYNAWKQPAWSDKLNGLSMWTTGYNAKSKTFNTADALPFWLGEIAAIVVHKVANKTINKHIRKATMGYLSL